MVFMFTSVHSHVSLTDFTGAVTEKGIGEGVNTNFNYPLPRGTQDGDYNATILKATENIRRFDPAYLLVRLSCTPVYDRSNIVLIARLSMFTSLGVDTYVDDPISDFKLSHSCYTVIGQVIADLRRPTLFVMEGYAHGA
jgi:acetoin utilization deacetylase AcuC-like enzyme